MAKADNFYFNNFIECAKISLETANMLHNILAQHGANLTLGQVEQIHEIENRGDMARHSLVERVTKDFITPLEREDIVQLSSALDSVTDSIEDIAIHIYINNEKKLRPDSLDFARLIIKICNQLLKLMEELPNFRRSKTLQQQVKEIHATEEEGDRLYMNSMKKLHEQETSSLSILAWKEIYGLFEHCCDTCADASDIVEGIAISNI